MVQCYISHCRLGLTRFAASPSALICMSTAGLARRHAHGSYHDRGCVTCCSSLGSERRRCAADSTETRIEGAAEAADVVTLPEPGTEPQLPAVSAANPAQQPVSAAEVHAPPADGVSAVSEALAGAQIASSSERDPSGLRDDASDILDHEQTGADLSASRAGCSAASGKCNVSAPGPLASMSAALWCAFLADRSRP